MLVDMELDPKVSTTHYLERNPNLAASPLLIPGDHPFRIYLFIPIPLVHPITKESGFPKTLTERDRAVYSFQVVQCLVGSFLQLQIGESMGLHGNARGYREKLLSAFTSQESISNSSSLLSVKATLKR